MIRWKKQKLSPKKRSRAKNRPEKTKKMQKKRIKEA